MWWVNANPGWLKDFKDFELEDFFGEAADGLAELGAGGRGVTSADAEGMGVDT